MKGFSSLMHFYFCYIIDAILQYFMRATSCCRLTAVLATAREMTQSEVLLLGGRGEMNRWSRKKITEPTTGSLING